jgi:ABC-type antimicrobial peptide transport system permease subunit
MRPNPRVWVLVSWFIFCVPVMLAQAGRHWAIVRLAVWKGAAFAICGVAIGSAGAFVLSRLMQSLLFAVSPSDPYTFVVISFLLTFITFVASYIPAHRAAQIDPIEALGDE